MSRSASRISAIASSSFPWRLRACRGCCEPRIIKLEAQCFAPFGDRFLQLSLVAQGEAEVVAGVWVIGLESQRLAELGDRLGQLPLPVQGDTEVVVAIDLFGLESQGLTVLADRFGQLALLPEEESEGAMG